MIRRATVILALVVAACSVAEDAPIAGSASRVTLSRSLGSDPRIWPNKMSQAMSDRWIVEHHDEIREMRPQVLVLNFDNEKTTEEVTEFAVDRVFPALAEASRYHGYSDRTAKPFLRPELVGAIDLTDANSKSGHSSKLPLKAPGDKAFYRFDYRSVFTDAFTELMDIRDPADAERRMGMCELFERGFVHDVWIHAHRDKAKGDEPKAKPIAWEELDNTQVYDETMTKVPGQFNRCAGNSCFAIEDTPPCKVTVRFSELASDRGVGCKLHAAGHAIEGLALRGLPYLQKNFRHFGNFDLAERLGAPFESWYRACPGADDKSCIAVDGPDAVSWTSTKGERGSFASFGQGCGNVHYAPNARSNYDTVNPASVLATCEHFGLHDGPDGADMQTLVSNETWESLSTMASDCGGGWQIYWRQSFPGLDNHATDTDGQPMKNWWPFLFY